MSAQPADREAARGPAAALRLSPTEEPSPASQPAPHPPLRALPRVSRRRRGLIWGVIGLLALALGGVLMVNIHVSNAQYELVQLQNQHEEISQHNQSLTQQLHHLQSPQSLSEGAVGLGMVMPATAGAFDLDSGEITAEADAADSGDRPSAFVATPGEPGQEAVAAPEVSEEASAAPPGILGTGALNTLTMPLEGQNSDQTAGDGGPGAPESHDLNGGTIPAPSLD